MKLYGSLTSPFVRKCRITAIETQLADRLDFVTINVLAGETSHPNPLRMVPAFETDAGEIIVDSRVICEFLASAGSHLSTPEGWSDSILLALADGMTDRAVSITLERRRPKSEQSPGWVTHCETSIRQTLPELARRLPQAFTPGAIALVCALAYLDLRHGSIDWRNGNDTLAGWYEQMSQRPSIIATEPPA